MNRRYRNAQLRELGYEVQWYTWSLMIKVTCQNVLVQERFNTRPKNLDSQSRPRENKIPYLKIALKKKGLAQKRGLPRDQLSQSSFSLVTYLKIKWISKLCCLSLLQTLRLITKGPSQLVHLARVVQRVKLCWNTWRAYHKDTIRYKCYLTSWLPRDYVSYWGQVQFSMTRKNLYKNLMRLKNIPDSIFFLSPQHKSMLSLSWIRQEKKYGVK